MNALLIDWEANFSAATDMATLITTAGQILGGTICIFMAARMVPSMAQSVVSGAALSFGHELFTSSASSIAHGAIGEKNPSGGRSGGLLGAGKTIVETLRNTQTATFRGVADTVDAAKEGGFGGAVEHVASHIPVVNNLVSAAKSGNMLHYVAASTVFGADSDRATVMSLTLKSRKFSRKLTALVLPLLRLALFKSLSTAVYSLRRAKI